MTEYELKQAIMLSAPALKEKEFEEMLAFCADWTIGKGNYLMLLSNEAKYYTIFKFNLLKRNLEHFKEELRACLDYLGEVKTVETYPDRIEFWIQKEDVVRCYILFDYTGGVIEI